MFYLSISEHETHRQIQYIFEFVCKGGTIRARAAPIYQPIV